MYESPIAARRDTRQPCRASSSQPAPRVVIGSGRPIPADLQRQVAAKVQVVGSAMSPGEMLRQVEALRPDVVMYLCDGHEYQSIDDLRRLRDEGRHQCDLVLIVARPTLALVLAGVRLGVVSCLTLPLRAEQLAEHASLWRQRAELLTSTGYLDVLDTEQVERFFPLTVPRHVTPRTETPTLKKVREVIRATQSYVTARQVAEHTGLSAVSVRRYLRELTERGDVATAVQYGKTGRPTTLFRWSSSNEPHEDPAPTHIQLGSTTRRT